MDSGKKEVQSVAALPARGSGPLDAGIAACGQPHVDAADAGRAATSLTGMRGLDLRLGDAVQDALIAASYACLTSAPMGQFSDIAEGRVSGSS